MKQETIKYSDIISLNFNVDVQDDQVYFDQYGFDYCIITKDLTPEIYLDWEKETRLCEMVRIDSQEDGNIKSRIPIINLGHLKQMINFFSDDEHYTIKEEEYTVPFTMAC